MRCFPHRLFITALLALFVAPSAFAQTYPSRPITLIVPYAAGGSVDAVARMVVPKVSERLGQNIIIENVAGAGGVTGTQRAARAAPDGYTLLFSVESTMAIAKLVQPTASNTTARRIFSRSRWSAARRWCSRQEGVARQGPRRAGRAAARQSGKFSYATSGVGTSLHVAGEMINIEGKVQIVHVPYRVGAQIVTDLMGNQSTLRVAAGDGAAGVPQGQHQGVRDHRAAAFAGGAGPAEHRRASRASGTSMSRSGSGCSRPPRPTLRSSTAFTGGRGGDPGA